MSETKKLSASVIVSAVAAVLAVVAAIAMVMANNASATDATSTLYIVGAVAAAVLAAADAVLVYVTGQKNVLNVILEVAATMLLTIVGIYTITDRILTISGLFSWNTMNTAGWSMFYIAIVACACSVVAAIAVVVSAFLPAGKKQA